jgi:hypothetical protein
MRLHARFFACGLACGLFLSCRPPHLHVTTPEVPPRSLKQEMAALAFLAYLGDTLKGSDEKVESQLAQCMPVALEQAPGWKLAWGPAVYHFSLGKLDDNMMYVVRQPTTPAQLAIVVRGTNPSAILDWLVEDFDVVDQVSWPSGSPSGQPKISKGTSEGLHILQTMVPEAGPVPQKTLTQFLTEEVKAAPTQLRVYVTGHSLGGALAPALALWLSDTQAEWDPSRRAQISVYPLAGPTPGNADFAAYYDGSPLTTDRMWNPFDIVPLAWNHESLGTMADLYEPLTRANSVERGLIDGLRSLVKDKGYTQIEATQPSLSGALFTGASGEKMDWAAEAGWQHHCGYQCAVGVFVTPSTSQCPSKPQKHSCTPCPAETTKAGR